MSWYDHPYVLGHTAFGAIGTSRPGGSSRPGRMLIRPAPNANGHSAAGLMDGCPSIWPASNGRDATNPRLKTFVDYHQHILAIRKECVFLSYPYLNVLLELAKSRSERKRISVTGVGLETDVPPTTVLRALGELESMGMVERLPDPGDKRRVYVDLTARGVQDVSEISDRIMQVVSKFSPSTGFDFD